MKRLESLLQERSAEQPQLEQQPLQPANDPVPATEWVANLHDSLDTIVQPDFLDFESLLFKDFTDSSALAHCNRNSNSQHVPSLQGEIGLSCMNLPKGDSSEPSPTLRKDTSNLPCGNIVGETPLSRHSAESPHFPITINACEEYLPPPSLGTALLSEFLVDFNTAYPLYRPHDISNHLRICYAGHAAHDHPVSWTSAYVVFGLAHTLRAMSITATPADMELAKYYVSRVYSNLNHLLLSQPSLGLVQCLIGAAKLIRSTQCGSNLADGPLLSTSLRVAQSLAYHEEEPELPDSTRDIEQERRVFWLSFICDTYTAIASNTPTTHRRDDIIAPKPALNPTDNVGEIVAAEGFWKVNFFLLRVELALLQAEAVEQVLSAKARNKAIDVEATAAAVLARLRIFHNQKLFSLGPDQMSQLLYRSDIAHTVSLESGYFMTVHRLQAFLAFDKNHRVNPFSLEGMTRLSQMTEQKSYHEARRLLSLLPIAPRGDVALYWNEYKAFQVALITVLAHHVHAPGPVVLQESDLNMFRALIEDLGTLIDKGGNTELTQSRGLCVSLLSRVELRVSV